MGTASIQFLMQLLPSTESSRVRHFPIILSALALAIPTGLASCHRAGSIAPASHPQSIAALPPPPPPVVENLSTTANSRGVSFSIGQAASLQLSSGMTQTEVAKILYLPDHTEMQTCGASLGEPWNCLLWTYVWRTPTQLRQLVVAFASDGGDWYVNGWHWITF